MGWFSVDNATLNRFFSLHYLLPFVILGLVIITFIFLHEDGSNNPLGLTFKIDNITFYPYFIYKRFIWFYCIFYLFLLFLFFLS